MGDIAIRVENLSKYYKLGVINSGTLSRDLQSWLWKRLGKEDPNKRIGAEEGNLAGFWALKDLNFEIKKGDRVGIIGKNGAGKSTLLKMISQISAPTEGKIYIDGKIASLLEVGTGFNPELTGRENIYLNGAILGMKKKEVDRKLDEIIAFSEIERHIDTPVKRYSSGMYVRLAFAVAAHLESDILIADEVLAVGDAAFQKKALGKMNELSTGQGRTVLFVSHNINQVKRLCSKGIILNSGVLDFTGSIDAACDMYFAPATGEHKFIPKEIEIRDLGIIITDISVTNKPDSFEEFEITLHFTSRRNYEDIGIQFMIFGGFGQRIFSLNPLETEDIECKIKSGQNRVVCRLPKLHLCAGVYNLGLAFMRPWGTNYYEEHEVLQFVVPEKSYRWRLVSNAPVYGTFYTDNIWIINGVKYVRQ